MNDESASKADHHRLEGKVEGIATTVNTLVGEVRAINERMIAKDLLEKQAQILTAEINATREKLNAEREKTRDEWSNLKTRALWFSMLLLGILCMPGAAQAIKNLKGLVP